MKRFISKEFIMNARIFEPSLSCDHDGAGELVSFIETKESKVRFNKSMKVALECIVLNLARSPEGIISASLGKRTSGNCLGGLPARYNATGVTIHSLVKVLNLMEEWGFVAILKGFSATGKKGMDTRVVIDADFSKFIKKHFKIYPSSVRRHPDSETVYLKNYKKRGMPTYRDYDDNSNTDSMRDFLARYNEFIATTNISHAGIPRNERKLFKRVFNDASFANGGRFYAEYQNMPKESRRGIKIGKVPVIEIDFSGLHVQLLYAQATGKLFDLKQDVYHIDGLAKYRSDLKVLLQILINATGFNSAKKAFNLHLIKKYKDERDERITAHFLVDQFMKKHSKIKKFFYSGYGVKLQRLESKIMETILEEALKRKLPILPVHDSCMGPSDRKEEIMHLMRLGSVRALGVELPFKVE